MSIGRSDIKSQLTVNVIALYNSKWYLTHFFLKVRTVYEELEPKVTELGSSYMLNNFLSSFYFRDQATLLAWTRSSIHRPKSNFHSCEASCNHSKIENYDVSQEQ